MSFFPQVSPKQSFPMLESEVLAYWKVNNTFQKSIESRPENNPYRFYDGPPFITGTPHYGSLLSSVVKDVVGRYWTMRGRRVDRIWGWDCHGLPIEEKVQKKMGLHSNKEIEAHGVKEFIDGCYEYTEKTSADWDWYIDKIGRWVDMDNAYRTMDQDYMESVMWVFKQLWDKGLIYEGKRVSLYSWKLGTPISNFEVAMDDTYQEVNDPAITVKFQLTQEVGGADIAEGGKFEYTDDGYLKYALAVIKNEKGEYLMLKNKKLGGKWQCPGGKIDAGETAEEALKREVREELGTDCIIGKKIAENRVFAGGLWQGEYYEVTLNGTPSIQEAHKHEKLEWMHFEESNNHLGWKIVTETGVTEENEQVKNSFDSWILHGDFPKMQDFSILAWTTTPWTIPANMALAVGEDIHYSLVAQEEHGYIIATSRIETVFKGKGEYAVIREFNGSELAGMSYIPPFPEYYHNKLGDTAHKIYTADFATDTDGTGIVHVAPEFGDVDFLLAKEKNIPVTEALDDEGKYTKQIFDHVGLHYLDANKINLERMKGNGTLFKNESITHRIPFCPRSGTPLVQRAQKSWFIDIQSQKDKLLEANKQINWFPEYLKYGRFAKGIESAPDWCISRTRFWGAPMPVWMNEDGTEKLVIGSRDEIFKLNKPYAQLTKLIISRHAESQANVDGHYDDIGSSPLSAQGEEQAKKLAQDLRDAGVDVIITSPFLRAVQTAEPLAKSLGIDIITDERLRETDHGSFANAPVSPERKTERDITFFGENTDHKFGGTGESYNDILIRTTEVIQEICEKYPGKTVFVVSHGFPTGVMSAFLRDKAIYREVRNAEIETFILDVSEKTALNLHRPYVDNIKLQSPKTGNELTRVSEVLDVWLDSGSMPYAQMHYPFKNTEAMEASFPADFIAEYVGQVRAWFYVMHVLGVLLNPTKQATPTPSFTNVITTGVINGNDGRKMSKSYGNYPDPRETIEKYGADPIRFYMLNSPLLSGGDMDFKEEGIVETIKSVMLPIWNTYSFFTTYANIDGWEPNTTEVWFVRHGESESNIIGKMSDGTDNPNLTETGKRQASSAGESLREQGISFDSIVYTDRIRTHDTAHIIGETIGFSGEYIINDGFAEQTAGEYANMSLEEIAKQHDIDPTDHIALRKIYKNNATENREQFENRILSAYSHLLEKYKGKKVLIVAHAGTPRPILHKYHGMDGDTAYYDTNILNADPFFLMTTLVTNPLDRWILSRLQVLIGKVHASMEEYNIPQATRVIIEFMDELTNWYVRLSRRRFWGSEMTEDKKSGYESLYRVLTETAKLMAPYMPFMSEDMYRSLTKRESVHLEYITRPNKHLINTDLNRDMQIAEKIVSLGLSLRSRKNIRVRQPLQSVTITRELDAYYQNIIQDELNVKEVRYEDPENLAKKIAKPDARKIGPKYGKQVQEIIREGKNGNFTEESNGSIRIGDAVLEADEFTYEYVPFEGVGDVEGGHGMVIAMDTILTEDLELEGFARDLIRMIQEMRKEADYQVADRIKLTLEGDTMSLILEKFAEMIMKETLSTIVDGIEKPDHEKTDTLDGGREVRIKIKK